MQINFDYIYLILNINYIQNVNYLNANITYNKCFKINYIDLGIYKYNNFNLKKKQFLIIHCNYIIIVLKLSINYV